MKLKRSNLIPAGVLALATVFICNPGYANPETAGMPYGQMMHGGYGMHQGMGYSGASWKKSLTKEQSAKLDQLKLDYLKMKYPLKAKKKALKIELAMLAIADKPDTKAIDRKIDEIAAVKKQLMKLKYTHKTAVRKELSAEQRVQFDIALLKKAKKGKQRGYHR